jgi:hypothetical protein
MNAHSPALTPATPSSSQPRSAPRSALKTQLAYWVPTGLLVLLMGMGGLGNMRMDAASLEVMHQLGYPDYFTCMLGVAKLLGVLALLLPVPRGLREWAYAGFAFDVIGAAVSLLASGQAQAGALAPLVVLVLIVLSRRGWLQRSEATHAG